MTERDKTGKAVDISESIDLGTVNYSGRAESDPRMMGFLKWPGFRILMEKDLLSETSVIAPSPPHYLGQTKRLAK